MSKRVKVGGPATPQDIAEAYRQCTNPHDDTRLVALEMAQQGEWTLQQIAKALGKPRATLARWLRAYRQGGLPAKMAREHGGRLASLNSADVDAIKAGLKQGGWKTAKAIHRWLKERGSPITLWGVYSWREECQGQTQGAAQNPQKPGSE